MRACLEVVGHVSTTPRWGNPVKCLFSTAQQVNLPACFSHYPFHDQRKVWKTINSLLHNKTKSTEIKTDIGVVDDPLEIANCLNEHFCSKGKNLAKNVRNDNEVNHMSFLNKSVSASMFLQPASVSELYNAVMSLNNYKSPGYDNIPAYFLRCAANILAFPLSILVNFSFELGCFPNRLKTAKVIPLCKSGDKTLATNYRPISLLTCFSKILEKLLFTRLTNFFD